MARRSYRRRRAARRPRRGRRTLRRRTGRRPRQRTSMEKKQYVGVTPDNTRVAQLNGDANGYYISDSTPTPDQGFLSNERIGTKIAVCGGHYDFQFYQQSSTNGPIKGIVELFWNKGTPVTVGSTIMSQLYDGTPFVKTSGGTSAGIIDYNSVRDVNYMKNWQRVCFKKFRVAADTLSTQVQLVSVKMGFRRRKPFVVRLSDTADNLTSGQFVLTVRCDAGNYAGGNSTLINVPVTGMATGLVMNYSHTSYYFDN